jgi:hypothetical protein
MKEISRFRNACQAAGYHCRLECSHSEEADPWCVLYSPLDQSIIPHIARIDRRYILVFDSDKRPQRMATIVGAVDTALKRILAR